MSKVPYGLTALMETINNIESEEKTIEEINDVANGCSESVTFLDAIEAGLIEDEDGVDDEMDDVEDDVDVDDPEINRMLAKIDPTDDDEDIDLESLDAALEAYIEDEE